MRVLMVGVDSSTKGGMWTVVENYINNSTFCKETNLIYIPTSITGKIINKLAFTAKAYFKILRTLLTSRIDIVHIHVSERGSVYRKYVVLKLAKLFKCKTIFHMHGAEFQVWYQQLDSSKQKKVREIFRQADSVIILGEYWSDFVSTIVDKEKINVVHNAVAVPSTNRYNTEAKNLMFLGVVGKRKGIDDLLNAIALIDSKLGSEIKLMIYGPNPENDIDFKIEQLNLTHRVEYKGWLSNDKKEEVFNTVALNVLPSYNEGLPMTILETMAYGIPNISTRVAAIPEAIHSNNGVLIEPSDVNKLAESILELMTNANERNKKSEVSFNDAKEKFSLENHIERILFIYKKLGGNS